MSLEGRHKPTKGMGYVLHSLAQSNLIPITKSPKSLNALCQEMSSYRNATDSFYLQLTAFQQFILVYEKRKIRFGITA